MTKYSKKPIQIEAVRYGKDDGGRWYPGAVRRVALFMLGMQIDESLTEAEIAEVVRPAEHWPIDSSVKIFDAVAHREWLPLKLGDYVIKGVQGEFYPCKPDIFEATYEPVEATS